MVHRRVIWPILFVAILLISIFMLQLDSKRLEKHIVELNNLSSQSVYQVYENKARLYHVPSHGELGEMYTCLKSYRPLATRKVKKEGEGKSGTITLELGTYEIYLSVARGEAYGVVLEKYKSDGSLEWRTSPLAVNCDLSLLNQGM